MLKESTDESHDRFDVTVDGGMPSLSLGVGTQSIFPESIQLAAESFDDGIHCHAVLQFFAENVDMRPIDVIVIKCLFDAVWMALRGHR